MPEKPKQNSERSMQANIISIEAVKGSPPQDLSLFTWAGIGIEILTASTIESVTIEAVCLRMNASKNQFHQHFEDMKAFHQAMLDAWYERETLYFVDAVDEMGSVGKEALRDLLILLSEHDKAEEIAIRNWALRDDNAYKTLSKVDRTRIDHSEGLLQEMGFSSKEARFRVKIFYAAHVGMEYSAVEVDLDETLKALDFMTALPE